MVTELPTSEPVAAITEMTLPNAPVMDTVAETSISDGTDSSSLAEEPHQVNVLEVPGGDSGYEPSTVTDVDVIGGTFHGVSGDSVGGVAATAIFKSSTESKPRLFCRKG